MTRKGRTYKAPDLEKALETLYGNGVCVLTYEGYHDAMRRLRRQDKARAKRVERILAPFLAERIFPRRQREWHETSEGTRARLLLLPGNPHVQADVRSIREVLRIPLDQIHATEGDAIWKQLEDVVRPGRVRGVVEGHLASLWLNLHRKPAVGQAMDEEGNEMLSAEMRQSAVSSADVDLQAENVPEWLQCPLPPTRRAHSESIAPLDRAAARLAKRHNLQQTAVPPLTFHILTQDPDWITGLDPLQIGISYGDDPHSDPGAFTVSLRELDEFVTKEDWDRIWTEYIRPRQEDSWEQRGMKPQGRRTVDLRRLQEALPLYHKMVVEECAMKDLFYHSVGEWRDKETVEATFNWDQETIRRAVLDLQTLLNPKP